MRGVATVVLGLALLAGRVAVAQDVTAEELLRHGVEQRRAGDDAGARDTFRHAYELGPTGNAAGQLGLAEQALGDWRNALTHLRAALATTDPWVERNRAVLEDAERVVAAHVQNVLPSAPHEGQASSAEPAPATASSSNGPSTLAPAGRPTTPATAPSDSRHVLGGVGLAVGGAVLIGSLVSWAIREATVDSYNSNCRGFGDPSPPSGCNESSAANTANTAGAVAAVGGIASVVLLGASAVLLFMPSHRETTAAFMCGPGPGLVGVGCDVRF